MKHPHEAVWTAEAAPLESPELLVIAKSMVAARRALHGSIPSELIHDTALDFLVCLFIARFEKADMQIETLLLKTSVAPHNARRWIDVLLQYNFIEFNGTCVALNDNGTTTVTRMLRSVATSQWHLD